VLWIPLLVIVLALAMIAVHEAGHFLAGLVGGIPAREMRIVLTAFPQHVALRDGDDWVSPTRDIERYIAITRRWFATRSVAFLWIAGGMTLELAVTGIACLVSRQVGYGALAFLLACLSLSMYGVNVILMDVPWAMRYRYAFGDTSGLWQIARLPAVLFSLAMIIGRIALVVWSA
jgi:hypothetical protein